ncbi:MAG TPA: hypothetical protein VIV40_03905 [Kofleriaceae bacterium]
MKRVLAVAVAAFAGGCHRTPEPVAPEACVGRPAPIQIPAAAAPAWAIPAPVLSRYQQAKTPPVTETSREMISEPPVMPPGPRADEVPAKRETLTPPPEPEPPPADRLPDDVVMRLIETGRAAFVRCFKKAINADPTELSFKVKLHVELDAAGAITLASSDATNPALDGCLVRSLGWLQFPASGKRVLVEFPLLYRGE